MKKIFPEYYQPTEEEFKKLWDESIFSFDANILLHVYRFTPRTREKFLEILTKLNERIWITNQAAYEYQKNRVKVILNQQNDYNKVINYLEKEFFKIDEIKKNLSQYKRHSYIDTKFILDTLSGAIKVITEKLEELKSQHPNKLYLDDPYRDYLDEIFDGKIGNAYNENNQKEKLKLAADRFKIKTPPGFRNNDKPEPDKYGDVILWFQLIDYANEHKTSIIFITDENNEDWWLDISGKRISPRPELTKEFSERTNQKILIYSSDDFIKYASRLLEPSLDNTIVEEAVQEAKDIRLNLETLIDMNFPITSSLVKQNKEAQKVYSMPCPSCGSSNTQIFEHKAVAPSGEPANVIQLVCSSCRLQRVLQYEPLGY